jgi:hypothetical protein
MNTFIVKTTMLGHEGTVYEVTTDLPLEKFKEIDNKYGMVFRHQSTTIDQLQQGAKKEGYQFDYKVLLATTNKWEEIHAFKHDYFANYGNY